MKGIEDVDLNPKWGLDKARNGYEARIFLTRNGKAVDCLFRDVRCSTACRCFKISNVPVEVKKVDGVDTDIVTHVDVTVACVAGNWRSEVVVDKHVAAGEFIY